MHGRGRRCYIRTIQCPDKNLGVFPNIYLTLRLL
nr:MAG TPA: hypothetical protein [Caudoviricetes sp.]